MVVVVFGDYNSPVKDGNNARKGDILVLQHRHRPEFSPVLAISHILLPVLPPHNFHHLFSRWLTPHSVAYLAVNHHLVDGMSFLM